jgi:hypothetical protein
MNRALGGPPFGPPTVVASKESHCSTHIWSAGPPASGGTGAGAAVVESVEPEEAMGGAGALASLVDDAFEESASADDPVDPEASLAGTAGAAVTWSPVGVGSGCAGSLGGVSGGVGAGGGSDGAAPLSGGGSVGPGVGPGSAGG